MKIAYKSRPNRKNKYTEQVKRIRSYHVSRNGAGFGVLADEAIKLSNNLDSIKTPVSERLDVTKFVAPLVYILKDDKDKPLYVGKSRSGVSRLINKGSASDRPDTRRKAIELTHHIDVYWADNEFHMEKLEGKLMIELNPPYNRVQLVRSVTIGGILNPHWVNGANKWKRKHGPE